MVQAEFPEGVAVRCVAGGLGGLPSSRASFGSLTLLVLSIVLWSTGAELGNGSPEDPEDQPAVVGTWPRLYREWRSLSQGTARQLPEVYADLGADTWFELPTLPTQVIHTGCAQYRLSEWLLKVT